MVPKALAVIGGRGLSVKILELGKWKGRGGDICFILFFLFYFKNDKEIKENEKEIIKVKIVIPCQ